MRRLAQVGLILALVAFSSLFYPPPASHAAATTRANRTSLFPSVSSDGRFVAFASEASNLVFGDANGTWDVFLRDRGLGITVRVSVSSLGSEADGPSLLPSISADGSRVAFASLASNLVEGDANGTWDVYVRDLAEGVTVRASVDSAGNQGHGISAFPSLSADGFHVAFVYEAPDEGEVFVRDLLRQTTSLVSVSPSGARADGGSNHPSISADGRYVAFSSEASNLVERDRNGAFDVFVHDRATGATELVSVDSLGAQGSGHSSAPAISADGRYVAFQSLAPFDHFDRNGRWDIYLRDRHSAETAWVSDGHNYPHSHAGGATSPVISADGSHIAFSSASPMHPVDTNSAPDIYQWNRSSEPGSGLGSGLTDRISESASHGPANGASGAPSISSDGEVVAYASDAFNVMEGDANGAPDIFSHQFDGDGNCITELASMASVIPAASPEDPPEDAQDVLYPAGKPIGNKGSDPSIRELPGGLPEAKKLFGRLSKGGTDVTPPNYDGVMVQRPAVSGGGRVGLRPLSSSGDPAIDIINIPDLPTPVILKIHFP